MYFNLNKKQATGRPNKDPRLQKYQRLLVLNKIAHGLRIKPLGIEKKVALIEN